MREIKFRAWHKELKTMVKIEPFSHIKWFMDNTYYFDNNTMHQESNLTSINEVILMQYIGSEDLNNKEAYEDDLIRYRYYHADGKKFAGIARIYFDDGCYFIEDIKTKYKYPMYLASLSFEIIGNIHENKEYKQFPKIS